MDENDLDRHIHLIYDTVTDPGRWHDCLSDIAHTINAKSGMMGLDDVRTKSNISSVRSGFTEDMLAAFLPFKDKDLWTHALLQQKESKFFAGHELVDQDDYLNSEIFQGYGKYIDMHHTVGVYLEKEQETALRVAFQRAKSQGFYEQEELRYLNTLVPHIKRAASLGRELIGHGFSQQLSQEVLELSDHGVLVVEAGGKIISQNSVIEQDEDIKALLQVQNNTFKSIKGINDGELITTLASVTHHENLNTTALEVPFLVTIEESNAQRIWLIEVSRFQLNMESDFARMMCVRQDALAKISIRELSKKDDSLPERIKQLYGLTDSEAEIAQLLADGLSPKEIADQRCRSVDTIRTQVKQISSKLGVKKTAELIALVNRCAL